MSKSTGPEPIFVKHVVKSNGLGDKIERLVKPIAKALHMSCLDENGNLKPDSGCAKRKAFLNKL